MNQDKFERIKKIWSDVFSSLPVSIPYVGPIYSEYFSKVDSEKLRSLLEELRDANEEQLNVLEQDLKINQNQLKQLTQQLEDFFDKEKQVLQMIAIIPTGGEGSSLFPITKFIPKSLITIGNRPMLQHILGSLASYQKIFKKVIVLTRAKVGSAAIEESIKQGGYAQFAQCRRIEKNVPAALLEIKDDISQAPFLLHYNDILTKNINWNNVYKRFLELKKEHNVIGMLLCSRYYPLRIGLICRGPWYIPTLEGIRAKVIPHPWDHGNSPPGPGLFPSPLP